jgi:hypothetical protein
MYVTTFGSDAATDADDGKLGQLIKVEKTDGDL